MLLPFAEAIPETQWCPAVDALPSRFAFRLHTIYLVCMKSVLPTLFFSSLFSFTFFFLVVCTHRHRCDHLREPVRAGTIRSIILVTQPAQLTSNPHVAVFLLSASALPELGVGSSLLSLRFEAFPATTQPLSQFCRRHILSLRISFSVLTVEI